METSQIITIAVFGGDCDRFSGGPNQVISQRALAASGAGVTDFCRDDIWCDLFVARVQNSFGLAVEGRQNLKSMKKEKTGYEAARDGSPTSTSSDLKSVRGATNALQLETYGQGRVWFNSDPESPRRQHRHFFADEYAEEGAGGIANAAPASQLEAKMLVYVFRDAPVPDAIYNDPSQTDAGSLAPPQPPLNGPALYLGIMQVVSAEGNKVTLKPISTLNLLDRQLKLDAQGKPVLENGKPVIESQPIFRRSPKSSPPRRLPGRCLKKAPVDVRDGFKRLSRQLINVDPLADTTDFNAYQRRRIAAKLQQYLTPELFHLDLSKTWRMPLAMKPSSTGTPLITCGDRHQQMDRRAQRSTSQPSFDPPADERFVMLKFVEDSKKSNSRPSNT